MMSRRGVKCLVCLLMLVVITACIYSLSKSRSLIGWIKPFYSSIFNGKQKTMLQNTNKILHEKTGEHEPPGHALMRHAEILLFGYQRGETTYVGHIVGCRENTFYFYEPFWSIARKQYFTKNKQCDVNDDVCRNYSSKSMNISNILNSLYKCDLKSLKMLTSKVQSEHSCTRHRKAFRRNISALQALCLNSTARVTKTLRISAKFLKDLIKQNPLLKVIYLYRDPRAIITSRRKVHKGPLQETMVKALCNKMEADSSIILKLAKEYPDNIILVSAERIAKDPINVSKQLFQLLNLSFTRTDENQINDLSNWTRKHKVIKERNFYPFKNDGYASSMKWRLMLKSEDKVIIDKLCQQVYRSLGYLNMTSLEHLRNISYLNVVNVNKHITSI